MGDEEEGCHEAPCDEGSSRGTSPNEEDEGHEGDEEEEGHEGNEGHGCHEGHESDEEEEGHEGHGCHEGHEGYEGHEVIQLYYYTEAMRRHAMKATAPASMKGVQAMKALKWQVMNDVSPQHA